jgi:alkaline phosphatase
MWGGESDFLLAPPAMEECFVLKKMVLLLASVSFGVLLASAAAVLTAEPGAGQTATVTLVGAGDISRCDNSHDTATARLVASIPGTVFTAGDNAYKEGSLYQFRHCYDPTWGRFKARTKPSVGNHEYRTPGADGYFDYFGAAAGERGKGYYSYDRGAWHIIVLNSMCAYVRGGCEPTSPMITWLKNDLAAHPTRCTLAYFHKPLFSSGYSRGNPVVKPLWDVLYAAHADVVISGHDHVYERFARQTPSGAKSKRGIREFVVGTGGAELGGFNYTARHSQVRNANTYGVLKLRLAPTSYGWRFVHVAGKSFTDYGSTPCH